MRLDNGPTHADRWIDATKTYGYEHPDRAKLIAEYIPDNRRVLDIGAGSMILRRYLKPGCIYQSSDIHDRGDGCIVCDLNKYEFPVGRYDWIALIGVIVYLNDPEWVLSRCREAAQNLIVTYNQRPDDTKDVRAAIKHGWRHYFTSDEFEDVLITSGWTITKRDPLQVDRSQTIFVCSGALVG